MHKFSDHSLPLKDRVENLISNLTLEEKCAQLRYDAPAIERLGISSYNWWSEALHGVGRNGRATVFPQAIGLAATWNRELVKEVADAISTEARAKHHEAARQDSYQQYQGLTFWSPNINIFRDPRWGRGQETWGEDVFLTAELGSAFVRGLQGDDPTYLKTAACAKHYAVHSGPEEQRHTFDAIPPKSDFWNTYLPAFERLAKENVEAFMGAYNRTYGEPCNGSKLLMLDILREKWQFAGHFVSDCWAIKDFHEHHKVTATVEESAALALRMGCDLNCGSVYCSALLDAVAMGLCTEDDVDKALRRLLNTRFKLGMFDPVDAVPYAKIPMDVVNCAEHGELALKAALESIVLLKNDNETLPITKTSGYLLVSGPNAANIEALLGNYFGFSPKMTTVLEGVAKHFPEGIRIDYRKACSYEHPNGNPSEWAHFEGANADYVLCCLGLSPNIEGEEGDAIDSTYAGDRRKIELPEVQVTYLRNLRKRIKDLNKKTKIIVLLFSGSAIAIPEIAEWADAILQVWYPGEAGGDAIGQILTGKATPSGRLPVSIPISTEVLPDYENYDMANRTYRFSKPENILFPFGFGLSFTRFELNNLHLDSSEIESSKDLEVSAEISNKSDRGDFAVLQWYLQKPTPSGNESALKMIGFDKIFLKANEKLKANFVISPELREYFDESGNRVQLTGEYCIHLGLSAPIESRFKPETLPLQAAFSVKSS